MNGYQVFLVCVLVLWPLGIAGLLFLMSKLEDYVRRPGATTPAEAGLEPVAGSPPEKEVKIVFGDRVVGDADGGRSLAPTARRRVGGESRE